MGVHDGHRERMKKKLIEQGLDVFDDHNVLELLLFYSMPRKDTNPLAHELLNAFGSLEALFEAPAEELSKISGIGENTVALLKLIPEVSRRYAMDKNRFNDILDSSKKAGEYLASRYMYERDEVVYVICLDSKCKVICCKELFRGVANSAEISIRKIAELALAKNATNVIISHNHTSGIALPSIEDEITTKKLKTALASMGIVLSDHIIVADGDFISMADSGLMG
ncbi:MAG: DNA repair protein RadC [Oscillospiraceae bacterium]|nr:DNA repair protein RadC [Oscillospiraceae bacterium]